MHEIDMRPHIAEMELREDLQRKRKPRGSEAQTLDIARYPNPTQPNPPRHNTSRTSFPPTPRARQHSVIQFSPLFFPSRDYLSYVCLPPKTTLFRFQRFILVFEKIRTFQKHDFFPAEKQRETTEIRRFECFERRKPKVPGSNPGIFFPTRYFFLFLNR